MRRRSTLALIFTLMVSGGLYSLAQSRLNYSLVSQNGGHVALGLALRKLGVSGTFMQAPAHPDDETNALFAMFTHGMGLRSIDLQNNRGDGGQNEIGPELFRDMGVLRTSELLSAHRIDGAEQYFTRAIDYGYSFDPEEVIAKWGRKDIVGDYVRLIRTLRPDVILTMNIQGRGGDRAHEATTILVREAYEAAGDPSKYPEQLAEGLRVWQPRKLYFSGGGGGGAPGGRGGPAGGRGGRGANTAAPAAPATPPPPPAKVARANTGMYDPLLGRTYAEIGSDARSNHKCQGVGGMAPLPGGGGGRGGGGGGGYQLVATTIASQKDKDEASMFEGIDTSIVGLAQFAGPNPPASLTGGLAAIADAAKRAQKAFDSGDDAGTAAPVEAGLSAVRSLRAQLRAADPGSYEIDFRLKIKERDYQDAVLAAHGLTFDAVADDGLVVGGQAVKLTLVASNRGASDVTVTALDVAGFEKPGNCAVGPLKKDAAFNCAADVHVAKGDTLTSPYFKDEYWKHPANQAINIFDSSVPFGLPFRPTPYRVTFHVKAGDVEVTKELPIQYRYVKDTYFGEKRMELSVVPAFSVSVTPPLAVIPSGKPAPRDIFVAVTNSSKGKAQASVSLELPAGWTVTPASVPLSFGYEDESLPARFQVTPPLRVKVGGYTLRAVVTSPGFAGERFDNGYQEIEYPHIERRQVIKPAETALKVVDVKMAPKVSVGYIVGVGDQVPPAIEQLGAKLTFIEPNELAWGDLSKYDVIVTGVRAYERRTDLRAYNRRLLDYAAQGGTVIVQYNKMEFNREDYGPFPAKVSSNRVSDETVPVKILAPADPLFNYPNKIGPAAWEGWVQERGLYFLGEKDKRYVDLVAMTDSFKDNPGEKLGSFVEGKVGKGKWIYLGLGLWRQLPAGTDGAYQLLANLISIERAPAR
jgi:GlcNAc-PI de-N-acetylase/NPCBM-associated, NEW3 domain of alpha-galactosidase